jgi:hypothetical protein
VPKKITVSILNRSNRRFVQDGELADFVRHALQAQVSEDFAPHWRVDADVKFVRKPRPGSWWLVILDNTDQQNWLGYHLTEDGLPLAKVFAETVHSAGNNWTVSVSHELLEMLADPYCNRMVSDPPFDPANLPEEGQRNACFYALEVCDPCSADADGYRKGRGSHTVSDFVLPNWFESDTKQHQIADYNRKIRGPFNLANGGYVGVYSMQRKEHADGWHLEAASGQAPADYRNQLFQKKTGRTWQRRIPRSGWKRAPLHALS